MQKEFLLKTKRNDEIQLTAFGIENINLTPCIICAHGFKGFKDWGFWPFVSQYLSENGFIVLSFNFSHNGIGPNPLEFSELDKFAANSFSLEKEELEFIGDFYLNDFFGKISDKGLGVIGHSRGGAVSMLSSQKIKYDAIALWSSIGKIDRHTQHQKEEWQKTGYLEFQNSRTKQMMRLDVSFLKDIEENKSKSLNLEASIRNYKNPLLILHGEQDLTVPAKEAKQIFDWSSSSQKEISIIPKTGHTFDAMHPFQNSNPVLDLVLEKTVKFFKKHLN
jgi:uncharacterized protein